MDENERQRRLKAYGFSEDRPGEQAETGAVSLTDLGPTRPAEEGSRPSTRARIKDSWGFRYGLTVTLAALVVGVLFLWELFPEGPLGSAASSFFILSITPGAVPLWIAAGVLAPPAPFRTGLLLGLLGAVALSLLLLMYSPGTAGETLVGVIGLGVVMVVAATIIVGTVGWVVRRVFLPPEARRPFNEQAELEPRARPWPPVVIALAYTGLPLVLLAPASLEWLAAAALGVAFTAAMIVGGLDVQRRYPERRTPVVLVGLVAGLVAGLAMLQAIWSESLWPRRRRSSDLLAIGVSSVLVVGATYAAYGQTFDDGPSWIVEPVGETEVVATDVELTRTILEDRLTSLDVDARLQARDGNQIEVRVSTDVDEGLVRRILSSVGLLEFKPVPSDCASVVFQNAPEPACLVEVEPLFSGTEIDAARIGQDPQTGEIVVSLELKSTGSQLFDGYADQVYRFPNPNDRLFAIVLDGVVESAPSINAPRFGGQAQISGNFTIEEAVALVASLQAGRSLPYPVVVSLQA